MKKNDIEAIIPHRDPFVLIDEVTSITKGKKIQAFKHVSMDEDYFRGHFPENPVMPGVLIVEALAQAGAVLLLSEDVYQGKIAYFAGIDNCRFKRIVKPGDTLVLDVELTKLKGPVGKATALATVDGEIACSALLTFAVK
jgi:3-hydroxyacyl-[acyl-carrier-protein] dehydratase